jgi:hypothetical protein
MYSEKLWRKQRRRKEVNTMKTNKFEIVLLNDSAEEMSARRAESNPCPEDHCQYVDYCTPSGCHDTCGADFTG